ncbi:MAG: hypothetical protein GY861_24620, partial [bacterium]|nr:hypothetical protein [bacterium]
KLAVSIKGASGEAEELADKIRDTLSVQFTTMISALQEAGLQIFDIFKDDLKDIVKLLTEAIKGAYGLIEAFKELYDLRSVSETFAAGVELISGGALDMSIAEFSELSFKERQKLVDRYEKELLKLREEGETEAQKLLKKYNKEAIDEIKIDAINKIAMYRSYLGEWGGLFDDSYKEQIKNQQQFLKELSANAKDADFSIGAELDKSLKGTNKFREVFDVSTVLSPFDESGLDLEGITEFDEALERETKILAELAAAQQKEIDLIDKKNAIALKIHEDEKKRLEMLDSFIKTSPAFKTTEKDASSAVGEFTKTLVEASAAIDGGMTAMLQAMEATIDVFPNLINAFTSLIDAIADFPDTMFSSLGSLQESVSGFASGGFGWRGREEREKEREIERQKMLELKLELESEWDSIIAVFDMTDIETAMYNLNEKYQEQIQSAFDSGASLEKLTEARNKEILSIRATELERNQALFSGIFTGAEKFKRDIDLAAAPDQTAFLMDEFSSFSDELSTLDLTTEEQSKILEQQLSTLKEMYGLAVSESAALEASNTAVQNMIDSLTLQSVGTSFDDIESRYNELYDQALSTLDTSDIQSFLTFTNDYMATLEAAGMDAESIRSDTKDDLGVLQSAIGEQLSEVAANTIAIIDMTTAVDEMALDLKEAADAIIIASSPLEVYQDPEYPDLRLDEAGQDLEEGLTDYSVGEVIVETAKAITDPIVTPIVDVVKSIGSVFGFAGGGLADNASIFGEDGPEWAIPAYNNSNNENFLKSVGMDKVIEAISKKGGGGGEQQIIINLNGKTIADVVVSEINNDGELTQVMKNTVN